MYRARVMKMLFGEHSFAVVMGLFLVGVVFFNFIVSTNYRKWWIYQVIMGKKAKPAGVRKWAKKWDEKSRAEAKKIHDDAERFRRE